MSAPTIEEKPRPCPFCGRAPVESDRASDHTDTGHVFFIYCHCGTFSAHAHQNGSTREQVLNLWNGRHAGA